MPSVTRIWRSDTLERVTRHEPLTAAPFACAEFDTVI
jgi:hypothetical protein